MTLQEFLNKNKGVSNLTKEVAISKRLSDENGKPFLFKIKGISASEHDLIRKQSTIIKESSKIDFDAIKFSIKLIEKATVYPNFREAKSIEEIGGTTPRDYIESVLLPGEIDTLADSILRFNGFKQDLNDLIEEAKN